MKDNKYELNTSARNKKLSRLPDTTGTLRAAAATAGLLRAAAATAGLLRAATATGGLLLLTSAAD